MLLVFIIFIVLIIMNVNIKIFIKIKDYKYALYSKIYFLNLPICKINFKRKRKNKQNIFSQKKHILNNIINILKKKIVEIEKFELKIDIVSPSPELTSILVVILSNLITFTLKNFSSRINHNKCKYIVSPVYENKNILNIRFNCIIRIKFTHIIYILCKNFMKWRSDIDGRATSNRKPYDNCNE